MISSLNATVKIGALLLLVLAGILLASQTNLGPEPQSAKAATFNEIRQLEAHDKQEDDQFGYSVAVSNDTAVMGARWQDASGFQAGAAYVYERDYLAPDYWGELTTLTASDAQAADQFGYSVAVSGDELFVGAIGADAGATADTGAAYVFQRDEGGADNWGQLAKLTASDAESGDSFGYSIAVSGDTAVVGARYDDNFGGFNVGAAYVFQRNQGGPDNWGEVTILRASNAQDYSSFGNSVAISGDTVIVGAVRSAVVTDPGTAYVFQRNEGGPDNWGEVVVLTASDAEAGDRFGSSAAINADTAVVGASFEDTGGDSAGAAYVFQRDQGGADNWGEMTKLTASDAEEYDLFGGSVTVTGDIAVIGASQSGREGAAFVFKRDNGGPDNWGEVAKLTASDEVEAYFARFGASVASSGDVAVIGAYGAQVKSTGAAYVYDLIKPPPTPTPTVTQTPCPGGKVPDNGGCSTPTPTTTKQPDPGDTDGDGCTDQVENGPDETLGGRRDFKNPWDFYDVETISGPGQDGTVDLLFDILSVINHYAPTGAPPYDANYDRGPITGPNAWNMTAPDGVIDLLNDILGVIQQANHTCA